MKFKLAAVLAMAMAMGLMLGCATTSPTDLQRIESATKLAAYVGAAEFLASNPESQPAFVAARDELLLLEKQEHIDVTVLMGIVNRLPVKELKSSQARLAITAATLLLTDYAGSLSLDKLDNLKPVAASIRAGLDLALQ